MTASTPNLAHRLVEVNKSLGWIEKRGENKQQQYDFVRAVDVFDDARDALSKHGVVWTFSTRDYDIREIGGKVWHTMVGDYTLINADNPTEVITGTVSGSASPPGDKGAWVVTTGMMKYALIQAFLLPTGDDPEDDSNEKPDKPAPKPAPTQAKVVKAPTESTGLSEPQRKRLFARFTELGVENTASRRFILFQLTGKNSTKDMTGSDLDTVLSFFRETNDQTEELVVKAMAAAK